MVALQVTALNTTSTTWPPGGGGVTGSVASFVAGAWAESGDTVARHN